MVKNRDKDTWRTQLAAMERPTLTGWALAWVEVGWLVYATAATLAAGFVGNVWGRAAVLAFIWAALGVAVVIGLRALRKQLKWSRMLLLTAQALLATTILLGLPVSVLTVTVTVLVIAVAGCLVHPATERYLADA